MSRLKHWTLWFLTASMFVTSSAFAAEVKPNREPSYEKDRSAGKIRELRLNKLPKEMKQALDKLTTKLPELSGLHVRNATIWREDEKAPELWSISLSDQPKGSRDKITAAVEFDAATGLLFSYEYENDDWESNSPPSKTEASQAADRFLQKISGEQAVEYRFSDVYFPEEEEDEQPAEAIVSYDLYVNNLLVKDFGIDITVNGEGYVTRLDNYAIASVDKAKFPKPQKAITTAKAEQLYQKLLDMELVYVWLQGDDGEEDEGQPALVFEPAFYGSLDAFTGKPSKDERMWMRQTPQGFAIQPQEIELVARSRKEAEALLTREFKVDFDELIFLEDDEEEEEEDEVKEVEAENFWESSDSKDYLWVSSHDSDEDIRVELRTQRETGKVQSYKFSVDEFKLQRPSRGKPKVTLAKAKQTALRTIEKYLPATEHEIQLSSTRNPFEPEVRPDWVDEEVLKNDGYFSYPPNYHFTFNQLHQNVEVGFAWYNVEIDPYTGKVVMLRFPEKKVFSRLPDTQGTISPKAAEQAYKKANPMMLHYIWPTYDSQKRSAPVLVYTPDYSEADYIDAFTGESIIERGDE